MTVLLQVICQGFKYPYEALNFDHFPFPCSPTLPPQIPPKLKSVEIEDLLPHDAYLTRGRKIALSLCLVKCTRSPEPERRWMKRRNRQIGKLQTKPNP